MRQERAAVQMSSTDVMSGSSPPSFGCYVPVIQELGIYEHHVAFYKIIYWITQRNVRLTRIDMTMALLSQ